MKVGITIRSAQLRKPAFTWGRDGEALLRSAKADFFDQAPTPRVTPVGSRLAEHVTGSGTR